VGIGTSTGTRSLFARPDSLTRALRSFAREDLTAYETMKKSTEKYHNGTVISCQKPCTSGYLKDLCCDDVFSVGVAFSNAAEEADIVTSTLYVGEYGRVFQGLQISGTFFQDFKLRNYPFGASMMSMLSSSMSSSMLTSVSADSLTRSLARSPLSRDRSRPPSVFVSRHSCMTSRRRRRFFQFRWRQSTSCRTTGTAPAMAGTCRTSRSRATVRTLCGD